MTATIRRNIKRILLALGLGKLLERPRIAHGPEGIKAAGHRRYVGGMWEEIGQLQFDYLVSQGLRPEHVFCDVACGSLRGEAEGWKTEYIGAWNHPRDQVIVRYIKN